MPRFLSHSLEQSATSTLRPALLTLLLCYFGGLSCRNQNGGLLGNLRVQILRNSNSLVGHWLPGRELCCSKPEQLFWGSKVGITSIRRTPHNVEPRPAKALGPQGLRTPLIGERRSKHTQERSFCRVRGNPGGKWNIFLLACLTFPSSDTDPGGTGFVSHGVCGKMLSGPRDSQTWGMCP